MEISQNELETILYRLKVGKPEFWEFIRDKIHVYPLRVSDFGWGCFPITDKNEVLYDIKVLVPKMVDEATLLVNIHELAHAFELFDKLGKVYVENVEASEEYARRKEKEYLKLKKTIG